MSPWLAMGLTLGLVLRASGCAELRQNPQTPPRAGGGATAGGLIAAAASSNPAAIAGGVILGGLTGGAVGNLLDQRDRQLAGEAQQRALERSPTGTPVAWTNPDTGHTGAVTPVRTYQVADGRYCREYQQVMTIDGQEQRSFGTACRQPGGSWKVVN